MADSIGLALTGLGGTLRDLASQEALYRQQERAGQLALAEVGLKSQLLQQQGQQEIAKQGVSLEQARSQTALGQFEAGLKSAQEQRAEQKFPLEQQSLQTGIDYNKFQLERGKTLLPGEQRLQQANVTHLGAQTGLTQAQTTELTDPNSPSNIVKREHAGALHQQGLSAEQDVISKTHANELHSYKEAVYSAAAPIAAANPVMGPLILDAATDFAKTLGVDIDKKAYNQAELTHIQEQFKTAYPYLTDYNYSAVAQEHMKAYRETGDRHYLELAQQALQRTRLAKDPKVLEKVVADADKYGRSFPDQMNIMQYNLPAVNDYKDMLMARDSFKKAYAQLSKDQQKAFDTQVLDQARTFQAQDAQRIDKGQQARPLRDYLTDPTLGAVPGANPAAAAPTAPAVAPAPGSPGFMGPPAPVAPMTETTTSLPGGRTVTTPVVTETRPLAGGRQVTVQRHGTPQVTGGGLAGAVAPTTVPSPNVPAALESAVIAYDKAGGQGPMAQAPQTPLPDGQYNVATPTRRLYMVEVKDGAITFLKRAR